VLEGIVTQTGLKWMEALQFVGVYRGQPIEPGKKSVTFRMTFRDDTRTLRDEEVNAEVDRLVSRMQAQAGAVVRTA
jgi:phenylalanyl-tRNA synthetase beta chain